MYLFSACVGVSQNDVDGSSSSDSYRESQTTNDFNTVLENYIFDQMDLSKAYELYYFKQKESSDEYVLRDIVFNPDYEGEIIIDIPAQGIEGAFLKEIEALCCFGEIPTIILASDFEKHILEPLNTALEQNKISSLQYTKFISEYERKALSDKNTERGKELLIQYYPICQYEDIYVLNLSDSPASLKKCLEEIGYTKKDCFVDYARLDFVSKQHGIQTMINFGVNVPVQAIIIPETVSRIYSQAFLSFPDAILYYRGEKEEWNAKWGEDFSNFYFYSATEPTEQGNFWHEVDGIPTIW